MVNTHWNAQQTMVGLDFVAFQANIAALVSQSESVFLNLCSVLSDLSGVKAKQIVCDIGGDTLKLGRSP